MMGFHKIIDAIDAELSPNYQPGAVAWADKNHEGGWSKAQDRFDYALTKAAERRDWRSAEIEGQMYKRAIIELIGKYKKSKDISDQDSFFGEFTKWERLT